MQYPPPTTAATYTTIPISGTDVIFRSFQNLTSFLSLHRPWPEFIAGASSFDVPESLPVSAARLRMNSKYFGVNYAILVTSCAAISLIGVPAALIVFASVFTLWLVLYLFREDPMNVWGHHVDDRIVIAGLISVSVAAVWLTGFIKLLLIGVSVGLVISAVHGVFRNPEGLFLDEDDAATNGLIRSP